MRQATPAAAVPAAFAVAPRNARMPRTSAAPPQPSWQPLAGLSSTGTTSRDARNVFIHMIAAMATTAMRLGHGCCRGGSLKSTA